MKKIIFFYIIIWIIISISIHYTFLYFCIPFDYNAIRGTLFSAFLTMGSFMLSLVALFLGTIKDKLFDNNVYKERINAARALNISKNGRYKILINISNLFIFCIAMCFSCSLIQLSCIFFQKEFFLFVLPSYGNNNNTFSFIHTIQCMENNKHVDSNIKSIFREQQLKILCLLASGVGEDRATRKTEDFPPQTSTLHPSCTSDARRGEDGAATAE